jgi:autotransporter-associated beta strand protein
VPNSDSDVATFGASNITGVSITDASVVLDSAVFNSGAPPYTLTIQIYNLTFEGAGIVNNSGSTQSIVTPTVDDNEADLFFYNSSTAGKMTNFSTVGGGFSFYDTSSAGAATFELTDGFLQATMDFNDSSTAASAIINASAGAIIIFLESASGGNATFNLTTGAFVVFQGYTNAGQAIGNCIGGEQSVGSEVVFQQFASAGEGTFTTFGASTSGEQGGLIEFSDSATADNATFIINGAVSPGLASTSLTFFDTTTTGNANITANGGVDGSDGGAIVFSKKSKGGNASIMLNGNAVLDITRHHNPGVTIGSLAGAGSVLLAANTLTIGSNNASTIFSGVIQGTGGFTKTGTGTLTLTGNNSYTGPTAVAAGVLVTNNKRGSATGSGNVTVQTGTLGGQGAISGPVIIGTGSGSGAFLAPSAASKQPVALSLTSTLTFNADATYTCALQASKKKSANDEVVANGVTIASGAQFNLVAQVQGKLKTGTSFTVISNTASTPISGTFANLADGATLTEGNTKLQASYEGGDGNDLTLTVVQ